MGTPLILKKGTLARLDLQTVQDPTEHMKIRGDWCEV